MSSRVCARSTRRPGANTTLKVGAESKDRNGLSPVPPHAFVLDLHERDACWLVHTRLICRCGDVKPVRTYITQIPVSQREIYIGSTPAASHSQVPNSPLITDLNTGGGRRS